MRFFGLKCWWKIYESYFVVQNMIQLLYDQPFFWCRSPFTEINNVITNSLLLGLTINAVILWTVFAKTDQYRIDHYLLKINRKLVIIKSERQVLFSTLYLVNWDENVRYEKKKLLLLKLAPMDVKVHSFSKENNKIENRITFFINNRIVNLWILWLMNYLNCISLNIILNWR